MSSEIRLAPMTEEEFKRFLEREIADYAQENVKAGYWSESEALDKSREKHQSLLPDGLATPNHYLFHIQNTVTGDRVGVLWLFANVTAARPSGFIYDLLIEEEFRRRGYARQAMLAVEEKARELGLGSIGLHVFAHNPSAKALYDQLGYQVRSVNMIKDLS